MLVRPAVRADASAIARIYTQGIEERIATFETEPRSTDDMLAYLDEREGLSDSEMKQGYILTCVAHPMTDDVVIEIG